MTDHIANRLLIGISLGAALLLFTPWTGEGPDQTGYFCWLSSAVFDGDLDQVNDLLASNARPANIIDRLSELTPTGCASNVFSIGPAVVWAPAMIAMVSVERTVGARGSDDPVDRWAWRYRILISFVTLLVGGHALLLLHALLREFHSPGVSAASAALALLGSPVLVYWAFRPAMSHALELWAVTVLWRASVRLSSEQPRPPSGADWALGLSLGILALIRWPAAVWVAVPACIYARETLRGPHRRWALMGAAIATGGALAAFLPQAVAWKAVFGKWLLIPQGGDFLFSQDRSLHLFDVLFSRWNGLFATHPWLLLAALGWPLWVKRAPSLAVGALVALLTTWVINAGVSDWWGSVAFGGRRWAHAMPALAFGWAALLDLLPAGRWRRVVGGGFSILIIGINLIFALLWTRGVIRENWIGHLPIVPEALWSILCHPLEWINSTMWTMVRSSPANWARATLMAVGMTLGFLGLLFMARNGRAPWPTGRVARASTWVVTCYLALIIGFLLWASSRSPHVEQHLRLQAMLNSVPDQRDQWEMIRTSAFEVDSACPAHLAIASHLALKGGDEEQAIEWLHALEQVCPRFAHLQILLAVADGEERREALRTIVHDGRWGDPFAQRVAIQAAEEMRDLEALDTLSTDPSLGRDSHLAACVAMARLMGDDDQEQRALEMMRSWAPQQPWIMLRLAELAGARGDADTVGLWKRRLARWCDVRLESHAQLGLIDSHGARTALGSLMVDFAVTRLAAHDPITEHEVGERVLTLSRILMADADDIREVEKQAFLVRLQAFRSTDSASDRTMLRRDLKSHIRSHPEDQWAQDALRTEDPN